MLGKMVSVSVLILLRVSLQIYIYNLKPSCCSDRGQFIPVLLRNAHIWDGDQGNTGSSFVPSGFLVEPRAGLGQLHGQASHA